MARSFSFFVLLACLLVGLLSGGAVLAQESGDFTSGVKLYQDGEYGEAIAALEKATQADPKQETAWYYLGLAKLKQRDYEGALAALTRAVEIAPGRAGTRLAIGELYETQNAYQEAVRVYQEELRYRRGRDVLPVMNAMGRALYLAGRPGDAVVPLQKVVGENPRFVEALYYLGLSDHALRDYGGAVKCFRSALDTMQEWQDLVHRVARMREAAQQGDVTSQEQRRLGEAEEKLAQDYGYAQVFGTELRLWPTLNKALGDTYLAQKEWTAARNAYRKALDKEQLGDPSDPDALTRIARAFLADARAVFTDEGALFQAIGVLDDAINTAKTAQEKNANYAPAHNVMGEIYLFQAKTYITRPELSVTSHTCEDALKEFDAALKADPNSISAMSNAAECLLLLDKPDEARQHLNKALTLEPKRAALHAQMAQVLLAQEDADGALQEAQTAISLNKNCADALNTAGKVYMYYREDLGEAIQHFSQAVTADPTRWESSVNLGLAFFQMESWYRARREFRKALDMIPTAAIANTAQQQAYLYYLIARTYHQTGMYEQEVDALNEALGRFPTHMDTLRQLALAYQAQKKYRAAEQVLQQALDLSSGAQDDVDINLQLGVMYEKEGRPHEAVTAYTAALAADPNSLAAASALQRLQSH